LLSYAFSVYLIHIIVALAVEIVYLLSFDATIYRLAQIFGEFNGLIQSDNYVVKRQSIKVLRTCTILFSLSCVYRAISLTCCVSFCFTFTRLVCPQLLSEVILDRSNFVVMMRYINDADNLMMLMRLLKGSSKTIQAEAFHVFKVFVANPNKSDGVNAIFKANRDRLIAFLKAFKLEKGIVSLRKPHFVPTHSAPCAISTYFSHFLASSLSFRPSQKPSSLSRKNPSFSPHSKRSR
jgi:hypothetical protein